MRNDLSQINTLDELWKYTRDFTHKFDPSNTLEPIMGGGQTSRPKIMFVFINPTIRNISTNPSWMGIRAPFIGTKQIWRVYRLAGLIDEHLHNKIEQSGTNWTPEFAESTYYKLAGRGFYLTNIVKWAGENADLPNSEKIKAFTPIFQREVELIQPKHILTFGIIPFKAIQGEDLKLKNAFEEFERTGKLQIHEYRGPYSPHTSKPKVIPCYFPVGRGDPKRAIIMLSKLSEL